MAVVRAFSRANQCDGFQPLSCTLLGEDFTQRYGVLGGVRYVADVGGLNLGRRVVRGEWYEIDVDVHASGSTIRLQSSVCTFAYVAAGVGLSGIVFVLSELARGRRRLRRRDSIPDRRKGRLWRVFFTWRWRVVAMT